MKLLRSIAAVRHEIPRVVPLFRDRRVPTWAKAVAIVAAFLVISPLDLLGDIPLLGFFDDGALLLFVIHLFVSFGEKRTNTGAAAVTVT